MAYESIFSDLQTSDPNSAIPSWMIAADNHNIGNTQGGSWFDPDTWKDKFQNAGKLIATGMLSGANSFYNTAVTVGNWAGGNFESNDTAKWISGLDDDLGTYYKNNTGAADLVGFIATSLIPGIGGIKVLNAGQKALALGVSKGLIGSNIARATGLMVPEADFYIANAIQDIKNAGATFSTINANTVRALGSGVWQNTLEAAAFETAVQATMFKSPILESQDAGDVVKNIIVGGLVGGAIGGAFSAAGTYGKIRKGVSAFDMELKESSSRGLVQEMNDPATRIILMADDAEGFVVPRAGDPDYAVKFKAAEDRTRRNNNEIRSNVHQLVIGEDAVLGNLAADSLKDLPASQLTENLLGAKQITRIGTETRIEGVIAKATKANELPDPTLQVSFVKLTGEGAGTVTNSEPIISNIADRVKSADDVLAFVRKEKFKPGSNWSVLGQAGTDAHTTVEARQIWASNLLKEIEPGTLINQYDFPVLERLYTDYSQALGSTIKLVDDAGGVLKNGFTSQQELYSHLIEAKNVAADTLLSTHKLAMSESGTEAIAKMLNIRVGRLEYTGAKAEADDYFAWQTANRQYMETLAAKKLEVPAIESGDTKLMPSYAKISKQMPASLADLDGNVLDGITFIKTQQKLAAQAVDNVAAKYMGEIFPMVPSYTESQLAGSNRYGAGAGFAKFANGSYGSAESTSQLLGSQTKQLKTNFRQQTSDTLAGPISALGKNQEAAIEYETARQKVQRTPWQWRTYVDDSTGENFLITQDAYKKFISRGDLNEAPMLDFDALGVAAPEQLIQLHTQEAAAQVFADLNRSGYRTQGFRELRAAQGHVDAKDPEVWRPYKTDAKDFPYVAFVKDPSVTETGHTSMIFANSEEKLSQLLDKVPPQFQKFTKAEGDDFFKARDEYEWSRTLHENYVDSSLKSKGIYSDFFTRTDPKQITDSILRDHLRQDDVFAMELMRAKNQPAFDWFQDQGSAYTKYEAAKIGSSAAEIERSGKNPYIDQIKTALDISKVSEYPLWQSFNKGLDTAVSKVMGKVQEQFQAARSTEDLQAINETLARYGMNTGFRDAATDLLVNHSAPKGALTSFIRGANAIMSKLTLGLDPMNALNNFVGANVLRGTETKFLYDAIRSGNTELAGKLADLSKISLPGTGDQILAPAKVIASAIRNLVKDDGTLVARYQALGVDKSITDQFKSIVDDFTLRGTESASDLTKRLQGAFEKAKALSEFGEKATGNKLAEHANRFISADVARQYTDLGVDAGLLTRQEQNAYINTFVNRVEGNTLASQRPIIFQGPIGQAIGLFQTYQFNLMQQMFRYVSEGAAKDTAMLLGLQGTFYGLNGLPAFQFINQHIVGTLSGNSKHVDAYDATYGIAGKTAGEFLLYGLPANMLQANIYSRGDINPRSLTVVPTTLKDIPVVSTMGSLFSSVKDTVGRINNGANVWESMLQGLEHNGVSRPLAGIAATLQATTAAGRPFTTNATGSILMSNDLMSWATLTRMGGAKPLDEAVINDTVFRIHTYAQYDHDKQKALGEAIKTSSIGNTAPNQDQIVQFAKEYVANGGKQVNFNKFMLSEMKNANTAQASQIVHQLQNPFAQKLQVLMGGASSDY